MVSGSLMRLRALLRAEPAPGLSLLFYRCVNLDAGEQVDRAGLGPLTKEVTSLGRGTAHRDLPGRESVIRSLCEVTVRRTPSFRPSVHVCQLSDTAQRTER